MEKYVIFCQQPLFKIRKRTFYGQLLSQTNESAPPTQVQGQQDNNYITYDWNVEERRLLIVILYIVFLGSSSCTLEIPQVHYIDVLNIKSFFHLFKQRIIHLLQGKRFISPLAQLTLAQSLILSADLIENNEDQQLVWSKQLNIFTSVYKLINKQVSVLV